MAGRLKIKCYEYNPEGKYLQEYESIQEVRAKYFPDDLGKRPLLETGKEDYFQLDNENFIANYRIGRDNLRKLEKIRNCLYCSTNNNRDDKEIEVFNLRGELIATFKNAYITSLITKIPSSTLHHRLYSRDKSKNTQNRDNLVFKYKQNGGRRN
jgi:hypothetical protein